MVTLSKTEIHLDEECMFRERNHLYLASNTNLDHDKCNGIEILLLNIVLFISKNCGGNN